MSRIIVPSREVLILLFVSTPPLLGGKHGMRSGGLRWSYADNFGVLARGANCTNVHLARLIAGVQKAGLDVRDISPASGSADALGREVSPANAYCSGTGKWIARVRSVARKVSSRRRTSGRAMELINGHESYLSLINRGTLSILERVRLFWLQECLGQLCVWSKEHVEESYVFSAVIEHRQS